MKKKVLQNLLPLLILTAMVAGCGKNEAAIEPTEIFSEATEVTATEETEVTETEDTETEATEVTEETETQETETQEPTEKAESEAATEEKQTDASKETNNTTKETASTSESTTAAPQPEAAPPVENNSQPAEQTQIVTSSATGREFTVQGSTGTTSFGTSYAIVSEFNKLGLNPNYDNFFSSDGWTTDFAVAFGQGNRAISDVLGYPSTQIAINVTNTYISYGDAYITRNPEKGYYTFSYTCDLREASDGGTSSRAVHTVMLAAITSNPVEVESAMYNDCFVNPTMDGWVTIGDCQVRFSYADDTCTVYKIKPLN